CRGSFDSVAPDCHWESCSAGTMGPMSHRLLAPSLLLTAALALPGLAACEQGSSSPATSTTKAAERTTAESGQSASSEAATRTAASETAAASDVDLEGKTIAIDPGHNGRNASHPDEITRQVPDGRGGTKACNTTGTSTNSDYSEADFTWSVSTMLRDSLEDAGASVVLSRKDNTGVGP